MVRKLSDVEAHALVELAERKKLAVEIFRPLPGGQDEFFKTPRAKNTLLLGGNRAGKTLSSMELMVAAALDKQVTLSTGEQVWARMPHQRNTGKPLIIWQISIDQRHIGTVIHPLLFKAGAFKVVYDPKTKQLRPYNKDEDDKLGLKPKPAPPLIPKRYVDHISWESKADNIFNRVDIKDPATGEVISEIHCYTSSGSAPQGKAVDIIVFDEQVGRGDGEGGYANEMSARLVDNDGIMWWASWPSDNQDLEVFDNMIEKEIEKGNHHIARKINLTMEGNTTLGKDAIDSFLASLTSDAERNARNLGVFSKEMTKMYPQFCQDTHNAMVGNDRLATTLISTNGVPPSSWSRYLALDPGTSNPAVLLVAIPPPEFGYFIVPYQEFYPGRYDPIQLAKLVRRNTHGQKFYKFICDRRAGRQQSMGMNSGNRVIDAYSDAFKSAGLHSKVTKHQFAFGSDNVGGRQLTLMKHMHNNQRSSYPTLRIVVNNCPVLTQQLKMCKKKVVGKDPVDDRKADRPAHDMVDALEYIIADEPKYRYLPPEISDGSAGFQRYMKKFGNKDKKQASILVGTRY